MINGLPSLTALRAFETVCRGGSVKLAAIELNVTPGAVSRQIGLLAEELGIELFQRRGNRLSLTADGTRVRDAVTDGFGTIQRQLEAITNRSGARPIMLGCSPTFAMNWLLPRMNRWNSVHPHLTLSVVPLPNGHHGITPDIVDAWIDQGRWPPDEKIMTAAFQPNVSALVMSADYARRHGPFRSPDDLRKLTFLPNRLRPRSPDDWLKEEKHAKQPDKTVLVQMFDDLFLTLQSARMGLGYMLAPVAYIEDELADGRMVAPFGVKCRAVPYYLAWPHAVDSERLAPLLRWLRLEGRWLPEEQAKRSPGKTGRGAAHSGKSKSRHR